MTRSIKLRFGLAAMTAIVLGVGIGIAAASHHVRIPSHVIITQTSPVFAGKVKSPNSGCKDQRKVKLHVVEMDNDVVGTDRTDKHGNWKIHFQGEGTAHYFASVVKSKQGAAGTIFVCKHDISQPITAP